MLSPLIRVSADILCISWNTRTFYANVPPLDLLFIIFDQRVLYTNKVEWSLMNLESVLKHHICRLLLLKFITPAQEFYIC